MKIHKNKNLFLFISFFLKNNKKHIKENNCNNVPKLSVPKKVLTY